jgi:hypothetical protein
VNAIPCHCNYYPYYCNHGHYKTVRKTCWRCYGTGRINCDLWKYPNWPNYPVVTYFLSTTNGATYDPTCCQFCYETCPECGGLGYKNELEWVPCPCDCHNYKWLDKFPELDNFPEATNTTVVSDVSEKKSFRRGLGVNKVKSFSE